MKKNFVKNLGDLRRYNVKQIATTLFKNVPCDPEIAIIAAWYVYHNKPPKSWDRIFNIGLNIDIINIPEKFIKYIMNNCEHNRLNPHNPRSLLPVGVE